MSDQLYLAYQLRGYNETNMIRYYERMLRGFPYSRLSRGTSNLRISAVSLREPPLFEKVFDDPLDVDAVIATLKEYPCADCAAHLDSRWDLWQYDSDWKLSPAQVTLECFGPGFEDEQEENLRIRFGIDTHFLPQPDLPNSLYMAQSNIRSLLRLVHDLDNSLPVDTRRLETETGENFAQRLQEAVEEADL